MFCLPLHRNLMRWKSRLKDLHLRSLQVQKTRKISYGCDQLLKKAQRNAPCYPAFSGICAAVPGIVFPPSRGTRRGQDLWRHHESSAEDTSLLWPLLIQSQRISMSFGTWRTPLMSTREVAGLVTAPLKIASPVSRRLVSQPAAWSHKAKLYLGSVQKKNHYEQQWDLGTTQRMFGPHGEPKALVDVTKHCGARVKSRPDTASVYKS